VKPSWAEYEALAHEIVTELAPFATVTHDDHIVGKESEARRQIDISARWTVGDDENLLIVQVKDCKRKADVKHSWRVSFGYSRHWSPERYPYLQRWILYAGQDLCS